MPLLELIIYLFYSNVQQQLQQTHHSDDVLDFGCAIQTETTVYTTTTIIIYYCNHYIKTNKLKCNRFISFERVQYCKQLQQIILELKKYGLLKLKLYREINKTIFRGNYMANFCGSHAAIETQTLKADREQSKLWSILWKHWTRSIAQNEK